MPTQQGRPIKIQQAELKTATITVKALTIDKRQVTLAWGLVRYGTRSA